MSTLWYLTTSIQNLIVPKVYDISSIVTYLKYISYAFEIMVVRISPLQRESGQST